MDKLGEIIKRRRIERKKKGYQLAREIGVHPTYITLIEKHGKFPSPAVIRKIEKVLEIDLKRYYVEGKIPADFLVASHSGSNSNTGIRGRRGEGKSFSVNLVDFVLMNPKANPRVTAVSFLKEFAPRKANDEDLISVLADTISGLRKIHAKLL